MKLASTERWTVMPAGAMTWLDSGHALERADIIVSTQRLNRIIEHEPADLIAIAEAGVTLRGFNEALAQKGQWLPLDPPDDVDGDAQRSEELSPLATAAHNSLATVRRDGM